MEDPGFHQRVGFGWWVLRIFERKHCQCHQKELCHDVGQLETFHWNPRTSTVTAYSRSEGYGRVRGVIKYTTLTSYSVKWRGCENNFINNFNLTMYFYNCHLHNMYNYVNGMNNPERIWTQYLWFALIIVSRRCCTALYSYSHPCYLNTQVISDLWKLREVPTV